MSDHFDVVVVGAGPAGYVTAIRAAQLGLNTACVDDWVDPAGAPRLGGTCLNVGCIPSKALLDSSERYESLALHGAQNGLSFRDLKPDVEQMIRRKREVVKQLTDGIEQLFAGNKISWIPGRGRLLTERRVEVRAADGSQRVLSADNVILAPGSVPIDIPPAPLDGEVVVDNAGALEWQSPPKTLGVIGAGVIGLELGSVWRRLGAEVVVLEAQSEFLPMADNMVAKAALRSFQRQGLDIRLGALVKGSAVDAEGVEIRYEDAEGEQRLRVERLIVAVGRRPNTHNLATEEAGLLLDERGFVHVDDNCLSNLPGVWAIGDAVRGPMLAHKGSEEGIAVAERIAGHHAKLNYEAIPNVIYTHPEIAWVGCTEEQLKADGVAYKAGQFPFAASGRARAIGESEGMVRVLADAASDRVLGVHVVGPSASEIIAQGVIAIEMQATLADLAPIVFAHPTLSESLHEAVLAADGRAIHAANRKRR